MWYASSEGRGIFEAFIPARIRTFYVGIMM